MGVHGQGRSGVEKAEPQSMTLRWRGGELEKGRRKREDGRRKTEDEVLEEMLQAVEVSRNAGDCPTVMCFPCSFRYRRHSTHRLNKTISFLVTRRVCRMVLRLPKRIVPAMRRRRSRRI